MANTLMFQIGLKRAEGEYQKIKEEIEKLAKYGDTGINIKVKLDDVSKLQELVDGLKSLGNTDSLKALSESIANLKSQMKDVGLKAKQSGEEQEDSIYKAMRTEEKYLKLLQDVENQMAKIRNVAAKGESLGISPALLNSAEDAFKSLYSRVGDKSSPMDTERLSALNAEFARLKSTYKDVVKEAEQFNRSQDRSSMKSEAGIKRLGMAFNELKNYMKTNGGSEEMRRLQGEIQVAIQKMRQLMNAGRYDEATSVYNRISGAIQKASHATKEYERTKEQSVSATNQLTESEQRLANALNASSTAMKSHSQILSDLKAMAMQYLGVWGGQQFMRNIIEIGGQLEMQRLSIGAILGDVAHANELFNQIKALAIKSPFGVVELDQFTKQLSAYGFKYHELYDMTKRLADISAGAGTEVSRLALALGHVKAEGALTGYTLRQFAMNNIPMIGELSKRLTEIEGHLVTAAEIRKRVSKKEIGYEDVEAVIKKLTDEGGIFYNMQEVISQSVKAKFKNLKDSMDIMYGEIAESPVGDALKEVATSLTELTRRWKEVGTVIGTAVAIFGGARAAIMLYNAILGKSAAATLSTVAATRRAEAATLRYASSYRTLTAEESAAMRTSVKYTMNERLRLITGRALTAEQKMRIDMARQQIIMDNALALSTGKLKVEELARAVALGRVTKAEARSMLVLSDLTEKQKLAGIATINSVNTYGRLTGVVNGLSMAFSKLGAAMKSILLSPQMWIFAIIGTVMELWQRNKQENERAQEMNRVLFERAQEGIKNTQQMMEDTGIAFRIGGKEMSAKNFGNVNGGITFTPSQQLTESAMQTIVDDWVEYIQQYAATPNKLINDALTDQEGHVYSLTEQYERLQESVKGVMDAQLVMKQVSEASETALAATNGDNGTRLEWLNDDLIENIKQAEKAVKGYTQTLTILSNNYPREVAGALKAAKANEVFAKAVHDLDEEKLKEEKRYSTQHEQLNLLVEDYGKYSDAVSLATKYLFDSKNENAFGLFGDIVSGRSFLRSGFSENVKDSLDAMKNDMKIWAQNMREEMKNKYGVEVGEGMALGYKQAMIQAFLEMTKEAGVTSDKIDEILRDVLENEWKFSVSDDVLENIKRVSELEQYLTDICGNNWHINLKGANNVSDVISKIRQDYKSAKDFIENNGISVMAKLGISMTSGGGAAFWSDSWISEVSKGDKLAEEVLRQVRTSQQIINNALTVSGKTGLKLSESSTSGKVFKDKKGTSTKRNEDKALKEARTRLDEAKSFLSEYKKYREAYGKEQAISMLEDLFPTTKDNGTNIVNNYKQVLRGILKDLGELNTEERKKFGISVDKLISDTGLDEAKERMSRQMKEIERTITSSIESYNLYKALFEKTGNSDFAMSAFIKGQVWDDVALGLAQGLKEKMGELGGIIDWDADEQTAEDWYKKNFTNGEELFNIWKKIVDLVSGNYKDALNDTADALHESMTYQDRINSIVEKYSKKIQRTQSPDARYGLTRQQNAEIAQVRLDELKEEINWDVVFGNLKVYTRNVLIDVRKSLREYMKLNRGNMDVKQIAEVESAITKLNDAIAEKGGLFAGLTESMEEYRIAVKELEDAERDYWDAVNIYGATSPQAEEARRRRNQAQAGVTNAQGTILDAKDKTIGKLTTITQSLVSLGKKGGSSLSEVGNVVGQLISSLGKNTGAIGTLIAAIFSILDSIGEMGADRFIGNVLDSIGHAIGGILKGVGNIFGSIFGDSHAFDFVDDLFGDGYKNYNKAKEEYEKLLSVWNSLVDKKKEYLDKSWGAEANQAGEEILQLMQQQRAAAKVLARERLNAGASAGSHSIGYRMWRGSYKFDGKNWRDVAGEISTSLGGVKFEEMSDMLNMSSEQLLWIKENYVGLWSVMDSEFRDHLDNVINYGKEEADIIDKMQEKLSGWNLDTMKSEWADLMDTMSNTSDKLAENLEDKLRKAILNAMVDNLFEDELKALIDSVKLNDEYVNSEGKVARHTKDELGNIIDKDVASEFTKAEWDTIMAAVKDTSDKAMAMRDMLKNLYGWTDSSSTSSVSSSIKGMSEEVADLLASYVNAIRADVSVDREMISQYFPLFYSTLTGANTSLMNIEGHTSAIMRSNENIAQNVADLQSDFRGLRNRAWSLPVS